jgi:hypothetical protein
VNLSDLKKAVLARKGKSVAVPGWDVSVYFLPVGVHAAIALHAQLKDLPTNDTGGIEFSQDAVELYISAVSASVANEAGERFLDSVDGRAFLREQPFDVLETLTKEALIACGISADIKESEPKNLPTPAATAT